MAKSLRFAVRLKPERGSPLEGAGDDPPDLQRVAQARGRISAGLVESLQAELLFMGGDLQHRCRRKCSRSACRCADAQVPICSTMAVPGEWRLPRMPGRRASLIRGIGQPLRECRLRVGGK